MISKSQPLGLDGVRAGTTAISTLDHGLHYRGYAIETLAAKATFAEVAHLLLHGHMPTAEQLADFQAILSDATEVPDATIQLLDDLPLHVAPMDALRTAVSHLAHFDPQGNENDSAASLAKAQRLIGQIPMLIAARHRLTHGLEPIEPDAELSFPSQFLWLLTGEIPSLRAEQALEQSLICYADHEFNASTFTARIVASTGSDLHAAVTAAIGTLKGPRHGGANENVIAVLQAVSVPDQAERFVCESLANGQRIAGFGHRVYRDRPDPRAVLLKDVCRDLATTDELWRRERIADAIEASVWQHKQLRPNVDWPTARLYHALGLDPDLYTPLFAAARVAGWSAHFIEQQQSRTLIQPRATYIGPEVRN